ncbi:hypothetical protein Tco_0914020 [Tanacetum coccineum]
MASHRSNSLYAIKECMTCGSLYTRECCSIGSLEDKILTSVPDSSPCCAKCGTPVDGPYCRGCAFLRKKFGKDLLTYCGENETSKDFEDISESSDDNTNVVNAPREPIVVNQDPGEKFLQEPPLINQNYCYECGDSLDGIFCQQCICKFYGKNAHYGYNCPPKVSIISNLEQCNQTIAELPQTLPIVHPTYNYENENSFAYDPNQNSFDNSPKFSYPPTQPQFETYLCELCVNNAHYGYDCPPQFPFARMLTEERFLKIKQTMKEEQNQPEVIQELLLKLMDDLQSLKGSQQEKKETAAQSLIPYWNSFMIDDEEARDNFLKDVCTFLRKFSRIPFGITPKVILIAWESFGEIKDALMDKQYRQEDIQELMSKLLEDYSIQTQEYLKKFSSTITPILPIEEPDNSLSIGDEHLDTTPSIKNLVPIPSEFEGISDDPSDVPTCDNNRVESLINRDTSIVYSSKIDPILEEFAGELAHIAPILPGIVKADLDPNDDISSDDDSYENIEYIEASPLNLEYDRLEEENEDQEEKDDSFFEESDTSFSHSDNSLLEFETFSDHTEGTRSGSTTTHANNSLLEYDSFLFEIESNQGRLISIDIYDNSNNTLLELP